MATRIYCVSDGNEDRLVRASSRTQAISHVARSVYQSRVARQNDIVDHLSNGGKVEDAGAEVNDKDDQA